MLKELLSQRVVIIGIFFYGWIIWIIWSQIYREAQNPMGDKTPLIRLVRKFYLWRKKNLRKEYFFYKNSITRYALLFLFIVCVFVLPIISFALLEDSKISTPSEEVKFFIDNFFLVVIAIATSFFVSSVFYSLTTAEDKKQKDLDALNVLRVIAKCHVISGHIRKYSKERSKCLNEYGGILNKHNELCAYFRHFSTPDNICIWGKFFDEQLYKCNAHTELMRINSHLKQHISVGYSVASANKPSLINLLNVINSSIQNFEGMIQNEKLIDIDLLDDIDACHRFLNGEGKPDSSKFFDVVVYHDMRQVVIEYKEIYANESIFTLFSLHPLMANIVMKKMTGG